MAVARNIKIPEDPLAVIAAPANLASQEVAGSAQRFHRPDTRVSPSRRSLLQSIRIDSRTGNLALFRVIPHQLRTCRKAPLFDILFCQDLGRSARRRPKERHIPAAHGRVGEGLIEVVGVALAKVVGEDERLVEKGMKGVIGVEWVFCGDEVEIVSFGDDAWPGEGFGDDDLLDSCRELVWAIVDGSIGVIRRGELSDKDVGAYG